MKTFLLLLLSVSVFSLQAAKTVFPAKVPDNMPDRLSGKIASIVKGRDSAGANAVKKLGEMGNKAIPAAPWITPLLTDQTALMYIYLGAPGAAGRSRTTMGAVARDAIRRIFNGQPDALIALYKRKDVANRSFLIPFLGSYNTPEANAVFVTGFTNSNEKVRMKTANAAKNLRWKDELFKLLASDSSQNVRNVAVKALKRFAKVDNGEISNGLALYLSDKNMVVRACAIEFMANKKDPRGLAAISRMLTGEGFRGVGNCASFAFEYGEEGFKLLNDALKSNNSLALSIMGSSSFTYRLIKSKDMDLILTVAGLLGSPDRRVSDRAGLIMHDIKRDYPRMNKTDFKNDPEARKKFESAIRYRIIEVLLPVLKNGSRNSVDSALRRLVAWSCVDKRLIAPTVKFLGNKDYTIRKNASELLKLQGRDAIPALIKSAGESNLVAKAAAMKAIVIPGCNEAVPVLIKGLSEPSADIRRAAANALGMIGSKKAIAPLKKRLNDPDSFVASAAVAALKKLGVKDAKPGHTINDDDLDLVLDYCVNSKYPIQRRSAQKKLEAYSLKNPKKFAALIAKADAKQLKSLVKVMASAGGDNNNSMLLNLLKNGKSSDIRSQIIVALKRRKKFDDRIVGIVMYFVLSNKPRILAINAKELVGYMLLYPESKKTVYNICFKALTKGGPGYIKQVFALLNGHIDDPRFVKPLIALLDSKDAIISHYAASYLRNLKTKLKDDKAKKQIDEEIIKSALPGLTSSEQRECLASLNRLVMFRIKSPEVAEKVIPLAGSSNCRIKRVAIVLMSMQGGVTTGNIDAIAKKFAGATGATLRAYGLMLIKSGKPEGVKILGNAALTAKSPADRKDCLALLLQARKNRELISDYIYKVAMKDSDKKMRYQATYDLVRFWRGCRSSHHGAGKKEANAAIKNLLENGDRSQKSTVLTGIGNSTPVSLKPTLEKISQGNDKGLKYYADRILQHMNRKRPSTVRRTPVRRSTPPPASAPAVKPATSLDELIKQSTSTDTRVRVMAVKGLESYKEQISTDALKARLYDPSRSVSRLAWSILRKRGINQRPPSYLRRAPANDKEVAICIAVLREKDYRAISNSVNALTAYAKKNPNWFKELSSTKDLNILAPLIPVFGRVADERSIEILLECAGNSSTTHRNRILAINSLRNPLNRLRSKNKKLYEKCFSKVIKIVKDDSNSSVRRQALRLLTYQTRYSTTVRKAWPELAKSKDSYVANTAQRYLPRKR